MPTESTIRRRRLQYGFGTMFVVVAIIALTCRFLPSFVEPDESDLEKIEKVVDECRLKIDEELAALDRSALTPNDWAKEWAGNYYTGDGLGVNISISIAPQSGIAYSWRGCLGFYDGNYGNFIKQSLSGLKVKWAINPTRSDWDFINGQFYFVRWGTRRYLVPDTKMQELVNNYNFGGWRREYMTGIPRQQNLQAENYGEQSDPVPPGRPQLPPAYAKLIIEKPTLLALNTIKLTRRDKSDSEIEDIEGDVELQGGTDRGLYVGLQIDCPEGDLSGQVELTKVGATKSWGKLSAMLYDKTVRLSAPGYEFTLPGAAPDTEQ